ncbi:GTP-binding protein [Xylariaceae sp. FL0255]|nr:GTP-binding protein [Xylariaceae sp. FL0255]
MASIFTYEPQVPRVDSPWRSGQDVGKRPQQSERAVSTGDIGTPVEWSDAEVERLEAEPQDGPIEYKLHLLLRPRRQFKTMSTTLKPIGSHVAKHKESRSTKEATPLASSKSTRENRLLHLTTQLLWRLMQSSPHHSTARRDDLVVPRLPDDSTDLTQLQKPAKLLPGLEGSNGALYEIGVADDGTFVGLIKDEMDESMNTLKVMAASLGCKVEVQKMKAVGTCEWREDPESADSPLHREDLWVAEALVVPILNGQARPESKDGSFSTNGTSRRSISTTKELRVSLIGTTNSGKTSLLGTLANGTLDNGRGSSRLNLLNHRHEVDSGKTSSVAQELIGYEGKTVVNYHSDDVNEWTDIHNSLQDGRLVFFLDSAGHPRYHKTTLRALIGWAPHWTLLCIAGNEEHHGETGGHSLNNAERAGEGTDTMDLAMGHLDLCLKLAIPVAIVITKVDSASKLLLKEKLNRVLTKVKAAGRSPKLLPASFDPSPADVTEIPDNMMEKVQTHVVDAISPSKDHLAIIPIVLTSAVSGAGIDMMHALLASLPIPPAPTAQDLVPDGLNPEQPMSLFHIDAVFGMSLGRVQTPLKTGSCESAPVVTGYVRFGKLSIGDKVVLGPFPAEEEDFSLEPNDQPSPGYGRSIPHPLSAQFARLSARNLRASHIEGEWRNATIVNMRELRLPVQAMESGQSGSIQIVFDDLAEKPGDSDNETKTTKPIIRKGQVLAIPSEHMMITGLSLQASSRFIAAFKDPGIQTLAIGSYMNAYFGMVRATTRVCRIRREKSDLDRSRLNGTETNDDDDDDDDVFGIHDHFELERTKSEADLDLYNAEYHVSLELFTNREWIELGAQIVLLGGTLKDKAAGSDGFVGRVIEIHE